MLQWRAFAMALTLVTEASLMFLWRCSYIWIERSDTPDSYARSCWVFLSLFLANASLVCLDAFFRHIADEASHAFLRGFVPGVVQTA